MSTSADRERWEEDPNRPLTRRRLVAAALDLVDEGHEDLLSMRMLAKRVGRQVSSLYNHVTNRAELVEMMRAHLVESVDVTGFADAPWNTALERWARSYFEAMAEHPYLGRLLASTPPQDPSTMRMYETVAAGLVAAGWDQSQVVAVLRTVESLVIGSVQDLTGPEAGLHSGEVDEGLATLSVALSPDTIGTNTAVAAFDLGMTAIVDGLTRLPGAPSVS
ncbi:MAG: TetR/AcrR family transcriptional regulator [Galactobacter sp.]